MSYLHEWRPDIYLGPSRFLSLYIAGMHALCVAILPHWEVEVQWRVHVAICVVVSWVYSHYRYGALKGRRSVRRVLWCADGWLLEDARGSKKLFSLADGSRVSENFILLRFRTSHGGWLKGVFVPVWRDSVDEESFRRLQRFLRWQKEGVINPVAESRM